MALNETDREFDELMEMYLANIPDTTSLVIAYREAFDHDMINRLSLPKKIQLRLFLNSKGVSFDIPEGTHVSTMLHSLLLSPPTRPTETPTPFPLAAGSVGTFPIPLPRTRIAQPQAFPSSRPYVASDSADLDARVRATTASAKRIEDAVDKLAAAISEKAASLSSPEKASNASLAARSGLPGPTMEQIPAIGHGTGDIVQDPRYTPGVPIGAHTGVHRQTTASFTPLGTIPELPALRGNHREFSNASQLLKAYSHSSQQFCGTGAMTENLASYHATYVSKCRTLGLTDKEALDSLHVLFKPSSAASIFYHKYVLPNASTLKQAFSILYDRFMSTARRDRLLRQWSHTRFDDYKPPGSDTTNQSALVALCEALSMLQLQLGTEYSTDAHLRDAIQRAVSEQPFATFLPLTPSRSSLDVQEACARAITVMEDQQCLLAKRTSHGFPLRSATPLTAPIEPAFAKEISYNDRRTANGQRVFQPRNQYVPPRYSDRFRNHVESEGNTARPGMAHRRLGRDSRSRFFKPRFRAPDGGNPFKNGIRMLCRGCKSERHFLRDCDKINPTSIANYVKAAFLTESIEDDSDTLEALESIQEFDDHSWETLLCSVNEHAPNTTPVATIDAIQGSSASALPGLSQSSSAEAARETLFSSAKNDTLKGTIPTERLFKSLADVSFGHSLAHDRLKDCSIGGEHSLHEILFARHATLNDFEGICMDNGAEMSLAGLPAFHRYCAHAHREPTFSPSFESFRMGGVVHPSMGKVILRMPIDRSGNFLEYTTDVIDLDVPILFGLDMMKKIKWYTNEVTNEFCSQENSDLKAPLILKKGHLYLEWPQSVVLFTRIELTKLHRRFAHPSSEKLFNLLKRAQPGNLSPDTRQVLEDIVARCNSCQRMAPKPFVFQVTMPDNIVFNHEVLIDLMWVEPRPHRPVLHVVDRGTRFSAARFVKRETAEGIWNAFVECWVTVYVGFPNVIGHDQGSALVSPFFTSACHQFGIIPKANPTESHNSLGAGERYHAPLRRIYQKLKIEHPILENDTRLSIAVGGLNNTAGPNGLIPTLLVFGMVPKLPIGNLEHTPPSQRDRFAAIETARQEMESIVAEQRLKLAEKSRTKPMNVLDVQPGSMVLVYREKAKKWEGPFEMVSYDHYKTAFISINGEVKPFSITAVKPYLTDPPTNSSSDPPCQAVTQNRTISETQPSPPSASDPETEAIVQPNDVDSGISPSNDIAEMFSFISNGEGRADEFSSPSPASVNHVLVTDPSDTRFHGADLAEVKGLLERGTYVVVPKSAVPPDATILKSRVIHTINFDEKNTPTYKSRLVIQGHRDPLKSRVVTEAPTILKTSVRIICALSQAKGFKIWTRDVKQAFVQSEDALDRELYIQPPAKPPLLSLLGEPANSLFKALKPLYGLTEASGFWWQIFKRYHMESLGMSLSAMDPCLFFKRKDEELDAIVGTLVDDTLGTGTELFAQLEETESARFDVKDRDDSLPFKFSGCLLKKCEGHHNLLELEQCTYIASLITIDLSNFSPEDFAHLRGQLSYAATSTRPEVAFVNAILAQVRSSEAKQSDAKLLNAAILFLQSVPRGLKFPQLDLASVKICGYADASFANNSDLTSQLGMLVLLCDRFNNASIIHYASWKSRRVTRSVLAAEVLAFSACFDYSYTLGQDVGRILGKHIPVLLYTDSKSIFDTITKLSSVSEKRLLIDIACLRQAYAKGEIENIGHVSSEYNVADPLTKKMHSKLLSAVLDTGKLDHPVNQWIVHH